MKLTFPFYQLNLQFDAERLQHEVDQLSDDCWATHPNGFAGNSSLVLVSVGGTVNDEFAIAGPMRPTEALLQCPYLMQVMAALNTPISRTRLMRLDGRCQVPKHRDLNYHWYRRTRVHIPIMTHPSVQFVCDGQATHMAAGEAWTFDNLRSHEVLNPDARPRIHLVVDTLGSEAFWNQATAVSATPLTGKAATPGCDRERAEEHRLEAAAFVPFCSEKHVELSMEPYQFQVLTPQEINTLTSDIEAALPGDSSAAAFLAEFRESWQTTFARYGHSRDGEMAYSAIVKTMRQQFSGDTLRGDADAACSVIQTMLNSTNRTVEFSSSPRVHVREQADERQPTSTTFGAGSGNERYVRASRAAALPPTPPLQRILDEHFSEPTAPTGDLVGVTESLLKMRLLDPVAEFERPVFIVSAPRSGSTLLFETLAQAPDVWTAGGESHQIVESIPGLHPRDQDWTSNCLTTDAACQPAAGQLQANFTRLLQDRDSRHFSMAKHDWPADRQSGVRLLAKTPKDALRIPFLKAVFPDARFIFLYREPHESISSIMDGWRSGRFVTYANLPEWTAMPWSFLLPPGWQELRESTLAEIAAFQWSSANRVAWQSLQKLPAEDWCVVRYADLLSSPQSVVQSLCQFAGWELDDHLKQYVSRPLPLASHTLSEPASDKWRKNEQEMRSVLPTATKLADQISNRKVA
ncbi:MAG: sulfotransferase [Planctomycetales bacterium]|jgi:LPS sulfotransferase NodH